MKRMALICYDVNTSVGKVPDNKATASKFSICLKGIFF